MSNDLSRAPSTAEEDAVRDETGFESLHPNAVWGHRLGFLIGMLPLSVVAFVGAVLLLEATPAAASNGTRVGLALLLLAAAARLAWQLGRRGYDAVRYRLDEEGLEIHRGIWWRSEIRVLRSRVQHTDLQRGPLDRRLGLADLDLHTAGSKNATVKLPGLDVDRAIALRDALLQGHDRQF